MSIVFAQDDGSFSSCTFMMMSVEKTHTRLAGQSIRSRVSSRDSAVE